MSPWHPIQGSIDATSGYFFCKCKSKEVHTAWICQEAQNRCLASYPQIVGNSWKSNLIQFWWKLLQTWTKNRKGKSSDVFNGTFCTCWFNGFLCGKDSANIIENAFNFTDKIYPIVKIYPLDVCSYPCLHLCLYIFSFFSLVISFLCFWELSPRLKTLLEPPTRNPQFIASTTSIRHQHWWNLCYHDCIKLHVHNIMQLIIFIFAQNFSSNPSWTAFLKPYMRKWVLKSLNFVYELW